MLVLLLLGACGYSLIQPLQAQAAPAPDDHSVLILDETVSGGAGSLEAAQAAASGLTAVVVNAATWGAMSAGDFGSFRAIVLGDPTCVVGTAPIAAADANKAVWGSVINGNVIIIGTDPTFHSGSQPGAVTLENKGIAFAAAQVGKTGAYVCLSCYYATAGSGTAVPVLDPFGSFTVVGQGGCPANSHIIATHPALIGLTDAALSNWSCSTHEGFVTWPATFDPLAISIDVPSTFVAGDGTTGAPYIMARGATILSGICLTPGEATNTFGTPHTVTAFVNDKLDCSGTPKSGALVTFDVISGPGIGATGTGTTGADGKTTFTYTYGGPTEGDDVIRASFVDDLGHTQYTRAIKHWVKGTCTGGGTINCPRNITVRCQGPRGTQVYFDGPTAFDCAGKPLPVRCTTQSGYWFHTGLTRVECFGPDDPTGDCLYCSFDVEVVPTHCPQPGEFWANHPDLWPVGTLRLGCFDYSAAQLLFFVSFSDNSDASLVLARYLVSTKLNLANCTDPCPISDIVEQADQLIDSHHLPMGIPATSDAGIAMLRLAETLAEYNGGLLTPRCSPDKAVVQQADVLGQLGFAFSLKSAMPNPFSSSTGMLFTLPTTMDARLSVFDLAGREVKVLLSGSMTAGRHSAIWDGTDANGQSLPNGMYFARLSGSNGRLLTQKLSKMR